MVMVMSVANRITSSTQPPIKPARKPRKDADEHADRCGNHADADGARRADDEQRKHVASAVFCAEGMFGNADQDIGFALLIFQPIGRQVEWRTRGQRQAGIPKLIAEEDQQRNQPDNAGAREEFPVEPGIIEAIEHASLFGATSNDGSSINIVAQPWLISLPG